MKRLLLFVFAIMPLRAFATDDVCPAGYHPAEYIELEYIESTGTQYIDTGIVPTTDTDFNGVFRYGSLDNTRTIGRVLLGSRKTNCYMMSNYSGSNTQGYARFTTTLQTLDLFLEPNKIFVLKLDGSNLYKDGVIIHSNVIRTNSENTIYLFRANNTGGSAAADYCKEGDRIYKLTFKSHITGNILYDFVPVRRSSDGAVGMYDRVENKFHGNNGTGEFIAGPEIGQSFITDENSDIVCVSCPANTYKPNAGNVDCTKCPEHTFSPIGSTQLSDCAKILRVNGDVVYMPLGKRTEHGLCVMVDDKKYCADVYERQ